MAIRGNEYDIIVVGAGTAGCALANRLTEDTDNTVLVLESCETQNDNEKIYSPGVASSLLDDPQFDWRYESEPEPGLKGRRMK